MSFGPWGELVKQGFQNFRAGMDSLSNGLSNAGSIYGGAGAGFQPSTSQQAPLQTQQNTNNNSVSLSQLFKKNNGQAPTGLISTEIQNQAPRATSLYDYIIR